MNDFRKSYQQIMNDMPVYSIDVDSVLNEARHKKAVARRRRQTITSSVLALCIVCLCGFGTAKAAGYFGNIIKATDTGFVTADAETMDMAMAEAYAEAECAVAPMEAAEGAAEEGIFDLESLASAKAAPQKDATAYMQSRSDDIAGETASASGAAVPEARVMMASAAEEEMVVEESATEESVAEETVKEETAVEDIENRDYSSIEAFRSAEQDAVLVLPMISKNDEVEMTNISVIGTGDMIVFHQRSTDGKMVSITVSDYADSLGHVSTYVYEDEVTNEREYITEAGYTYTLLDTVDEEGVYCGLHAAIAVGTYEIIADFWGYSEEEALDMIESMDLTAYITE